MFKIRIRASYILAFSILVLSSGIAVWILNWRQAPAGCDKDYSFINPALNCQEHPVISKAGYSIFENKLSLAIDGMKKDGRAKDVAVFFRDLSNGPTFGIDEEKNFIPASLLKVPILMAFLKRAEEDPGWLERTLVYDAWLEEEDDRLVQNLAPEHTLEAGGVYTIDELLFRMTAYSDNRSMALLTRFDEEYFAGHELVTATYRDLGIIDVGADITGKILTAKQNASFFRLLYNASYLSNELSNKALEYLARSGYEDGLRGDIPKNIRITHKFGLRDLEGQKQLHDCGIIYYPQNPYLLCVMTEGDNSDDLASVIREISNSVWREIESRKL